MSKIELEFNNLLGQLSDKQFWDWVSNWYDEDSILRIVRDWEDDIKEEEIKKLKKILYSQRQEVRHSSLKKRG